MNPARTKALPSLYSHSVERTRRVWLILQIFTIVLFLAVFNHRFSWYRTMIIRDASVIKNHHHSLDKLSPEDAIEAFKYGYHKTVEHEGKMKFIDLDWIGSEIYVDDLPFIASIALTILLAWYLFAYRRTVGIMLRIKRVAENPEISDEEKLELAYHVSYSQIFNKANDDDDATAILHLDENGQLKRIKSKTTSKTLKWSGIGLRLLIIAPLALLFSVWVLDGYETFVDEREELAVFATSKPYTTYHVFMNPSPALKEQFTNSNKTDSLRFIQFEIWARTILPLIPMGIAFFQLILARRIRKNEETLSNAIDGEFLSDKFNSELPLDVNVDSQQPIPEESSKEEDQPDP